LQLVIGITDTNDFICTTYVSNDLYSLKSLKKRENIELCYGKNICVNWKLSP